MKVILPRQSEDSILEPAYPRFSKLRLLPSSRCLKTTKTTSKRALKGRRGCRSCVACRVWKQGVCFVRSRAKRGSPQFDLRMWRTCNHCSRLRKNLDEDEHFEQHGGVEAYQEVSGAPELYVQALRTNKY
ncbi:hypothetical protein Daus18300_005736 [Diaporthe australafricana]|uniref:C2H2-type domain-containing protein n=1 Tax=Diaporthe australafricana TaxID=127596 RepID=A0ABR3WZ33_9PEZI